MSDELHNLRRDVQRLSLMVERLQHAPTGRNDGRPPVFLAKKNTAKQWVERTVSNGAIVDMATGGKPRQCTVDTAPSALISRGTSVFLLECRDEIGLRYLEIGSVGTTLVKVTGNLSGGGKYSGTIWKQPVATTVANTGNLTEAEIGQVGDSVMILNAAEVGLTTHALTAGTAKIKIFQAHLSTAVSTDATPLPVYIITGVDIEVCT